MGYKYTDALFNIKKFTVVIEVDGVEDTLKMSATDHAVLQVLAHRANNETGYCWSSYVQIARDCKLSKSAVQTSIGRLELMGFFRSGLDPEFPTRKCLTYWLSLDKLMAADNAGKKPTAASPKKERMIKVNGVLIPMSRVQRTVKPTTGTFDITDGDNELDFINEPQTYTSFNLDDEGDDLD